MQFISSLAAEPRSLLQRNTKIIHERAEFIEHDETVLGFGLNVRTWKFETSCVHCTAIYSEQCIVARATY